MRSRAAVVALAVLAAASTGCDKSPKTYVMRQFTESYALEISTDPSPAHARERTIYKVIVRDKNTGQPVEGGEGRIFANNVDNMQANTWDSLVAGPEVGSYYAHLNFIVAGEWAVAIQFRRDSTRALERSDWRQTVAGERTSSAE